tara:strand:+ start:2087 stop:2293 length:207 start_codon:yes stop_codon:yes gene_type:complete
MRIQTYYILVMIDRVTKEVQTELHKTQSQARERAMEIMGYMGPWRAFKKAMDSSPSMILSIQTISINL